jgi:hypothetical protein
MTIAFTVHNLFSKELSVHAKGRRLRTTTSASSSPTPDIDGPRRRVVCWSARAACSASRCSRWPERRRRRHQPARAIDFDYAFHHASDWDNSARGLMTTATRQGGLQLREEHRRRAGVLREQQIARISGQLQHRPTDQHGPGAARRATGPVTVPSPQQVKTLPRPRRSAQCRRREADHHQSKVIGPTRSRRPASHPLRPRYVPRQRSLGAPVNGKAGGPPYHDQAPASTATRIVGQPDVLHQASRFRRTPR